MDSLLGVVSPVPVASCYILSIGTEAGCRQSHGLARFALPNALFANTLYKVPFPTAKLFGAAVEQFQTAFDVIGLVFMVGQADVAMIVNLLATSTLSQSFIQALGECLHSHVVSSTATSIAAINTTRLGLRTPHLTMRLGIEVGRARWVCLVDIFANRRLIPARYGNAL